MRIQEIYPKFTFWNPIMLKIILLLKFIKVKNFAQNCKFIERKKSSEQVIPNYEKYFKFKNLKTQKISTDSR